MSYRSDRWAGVTIATASATLRPNIIQPYSTAAGNISQTLPQASSFGPSDSIYLLLETAGNTLTVTPFAGDTINGVSTALQFSLKNQGVLLVRDATTTNWLMVGSVALSSAPRWNENVPGGSPVAAAINDFVRLSSAPYTVTLPAITAGNRGYSIMVKMEADDPDPVTITPNGADTIEGAASFQFSSDRGAVLLVPWSTNWDVC